MDFSEILSIDENSDEAARDAMNRFRTGSTLVSDDSTIGHHVLCGDGSLFLFADVASSRPARGVTVPRGAHHTPPDISDEQEHGVHDGVLGLRDRLHGASSRLSRRGVVRVSRATTRFQVFGFRVFPARSRATPSPEAAARASIERASHLPPSPPQSTPSPSRRSASISPRPSPAASSARACARRRPRERRNPPRRSPCALTATSACDCTTSRRSRGAARSRRARAAATAPDR